MPPRWMTYPASAFLQRLPVTGQDKRGTMVTRTDGFCFLILPTQEETVRHESNPVVLVPLSATIATAGYFAVQVFDALFDWLFSGVATVT